MNTECENEEPETETRQWIAVKREHTLHEGTVKMTSNTNLLEDALANGDLEITYFKDREELDEKIRLLYSISGSFHNSFTRKVADTLRECAIDY